MEANAKADKKPNWLEENFEETILVVLLFLMAAIMGIQVFSRYVLKSSLTWSEELTRYMFIWSGFLSVSYCARKRLGLRVDLLLNSLPKRAARAMQIVGLVFETSIFIYLLPYAYAIMARAVETERLSPAMQIPMWMMQSAPFVGFGLVAVRLLQRLNQEANGEAVAAKTAEEEAVEHFVEEAKTDLGAGHSSEESMRRSWTYRWTRRNSTRREDKK